ncbi:MAG: SAM-dependent methyltransferase [Nocardioides sp.]
MSTDGVFCEYTELFRTDRELSERDLVRTMPLHALHLPDGPVVDIGAGTGLGTIALAEAFPDREVLAVEPDRTARAVLAGRVADHGLADRVTVYADDVETADLPTCAGAIGIHLLCELTDGGIPGFLSRLDFLLDDDGAMLVDSCFGPAAAEPEESTLRMAQTVGRRRYECWSAAEVAEGRLRVHHSFRTLEGGQLVREESVSRDYLPTTRAEVDEMFAAAGFAAEPVGESYVVLSRA